LFCVEFFLKKVWGNKKKRLLLRKHQKTMKMPKSIILVGFAFLMAFTPVMGESLGGADLSTAQSEMAEIKFYVKGFNIRIVNAAKYDMQVYSLTGSCVATFRIDSEDKTVSLNLPKGIYILKVGEVARKIFLK